MSFWYLASPYSLFGGGKKEAAEVAASNAALLIENGIPALSPVAHSHPISRVMHPHHDTHDTWLGVDEHFMEAAGGLIVLKMDGWDKSEGVKYEIEFFKKAGKEIIYMVPGVVPCELEPPRAFTFSYGLSDAVDSAIVTYDTGAVRSKDAESTRYDLISPIGLRRVAEAYAEGAKKYAPFNWEKGMGVSSILNHAIRHLFMYLAGDRTEDHLGHAAWNCLAACHSEEKWPDLNKDLRGPNCERPV